MKRFFNLHYADIPALLSVTVLYALLAETVLRFFSPDGVVSIVWPSSGLALAVLLIGGVRFWPAVSLGALLGNLMADNPFGISLGIAVGNTLEVVVAVLLLRHTRFNINMTHLYDYLWLALAGAAGCMISALNGNLLLLYNGILPQQNFLDSLGNWWQGDLSGILIITPLVLVWRHLPPGPFSSTKILEAFACFGLTFLAGQSIFHQWFNEELNGNLQDYWIFLFTAWAAVRFGRHGAVLLIGMISIQALLGVIHMDTTLALATREESLLNSWFFILITAVICISLTLTLYERKLTETELRESESKFRSVIECTNVPFLLHDGNQRITFLNNAFIRTFGYHLDDIPCLTTWFEKFCPDDTYRQWFRAEWQVRLEKANREEHEAEPLEADIHCHDGSTRAVIISSSRLGNGRQDLYLMTLFDISDRKQAAEASQLASLVYQNISEAVMVTDERNQIIDINPAFTTVTGYTANEVIGQNPHFLSSGKHDSAFYHSMWQTLNQTGHWHGEVWNKRKNGELFPEWKTINTIHNADGSLYRRVALFSDISKKKESEELIWHQANFDSLTGLPNRRMFMDRLEHEIKQCQRNNAQLAVLFIDLDRFKDVNDALGHSLGDTLLKAVADRLSGCIRESDTAARFGGDEYTILLNAIGSPATIERVIHQLLQKLSEPFVLESEVLYMTSSIGVAVYPDDANNIEDLIRKADQAMYQAKEDGRNRACYYTPKMQEAIQNRMQLANDLRVAIREDQFLVYYQPIVELASGKINKSEALIRWPHPTRGFVCPDEFIPIAEDTGLIIDIGKRVFDKVTQKIIHWRNQLNAEIQVSVNKSPIEFYNDLDGKSSWVDSLCKLGLPGHCMIVEITEGLLLNPAEHVIDEFNKLRDAGIGVALDDFGTGYSSLAYLKKFDIDFLKIDKTFICNLTSDSEDMALCEAIIVMAHKLGLKVIAEGIETKEQYNLLLKAGCDYGQGYLFSKPLPASDFELLLTQQQNDESITLACMS